MGPETKNCQNCKANFVIEPADFDFYKKMKVPPPTFCPQCRLVRRFSWRNERSLHRRKCAKCDKAMISIFAPDTPMTIYCSACWWSDNWEGMDYGVDFDPTKPFLVQLKALLNKVPIMNVYSLYTTLVNSDYVNMCGWCKNCYLTTYSDRNEDCSYGSFIVDSSDSIDNLQIKDCEFMYESVNCQSCNQVFYSADCESCHNVYFSRNCVGCSDCFGCVNLSNKKYHIFNEKYSKADYEKKIAEFKYNTVAGREKLFAQVEEFSKKFPRRFMHGYLNAGVSGDYIFHAKNVRDSYVVLKGEDSRFCSYVEAIKDSYDCTNYFMNSELMYDSIQSGGPGQNVKFSWWVIDSNRDVEYGMFNVGSSQMFGCVGVKKKEYCILNKQYSKEEFKKLRTQIIEQMNAVPYVDKRGNQYRYGEFFPTELSPFGYNETTAQEFFPLTKDEAQQKGFNWKESSQKPHQATLSPDAIPATIDKVDDSILKQTIGCVHAGKCNHGCTNAFKLIPPELNFYRQFNIPIPTMCFNCRHHRRMEQRNPVGLSRRKCQCAGSTNNSQQTTDNRYSNQAVHSHGKTACTNEFETSYAPDRSEIVYCEQCYQQEVA